MNLNEYQQEDKLVKDIKENKYNIKKLKNIKNRQQYYNKNQEQYNEGTPECVQQ